MKIRGKFWMALRFTTVPKQEDLNSNFIMLVLKKNSICNNLLLIFIRFSKEGLWKHSKTLLILENFRNNPKSFVQKDFIHLPSKFVFKAQKIKNVPTTCVEKICSSVFIRTFSKFFQHTIFLKAYNILRTLSLINCYQALLF